MFCHGFQLLCPGVTMARAPGTAGCVLVSTPREALAVSANFSSGVAPGVFLLLVLKKINSNAELPVCSGSGDLLLPEVRFQWGIWSGPWHDFSLLISVD